LATILAEEDTLTAQRKAFLVGRCRRLRVEGAWVQSAHLPHANVDGDGILIAIRSAAAVTAWSVTELSVATCSDAKLSPMARQRHNTGADVGG